MNEDWYTPEPNSGCWLWLRGCTGSGYGKVWVGKRHVRAHRHSYEIYRGDIPDDMCVLHSCDVPLCINPAHLFLGTNRDNTIDMVSKGRHYRKKIPTEDYQYILVMQSLGVSRQQLADEYEVTVSAIDKIRERYT